MAFSGFLKIEGINGEATAPGYAKWLQLNSWSWGASRGSSPGPGPLSVQSFSFTAHVGPHSAKLLALLAGGKAARTGTLAVTKEAGKSLPAVEVKMDFTEVFLSVYDIGEDSGAAPEEQVSFNFRTVEMITGGNSTLIGPPG